MSPLATAELEEFRRKLAAAPDQALSQIAGCMLDELVDLLRRLSPTDVSEISTMADVLARELRRRALLDVVDSALVRVLRGNA